MKKIMCSILNFCLCSFVIFYPTSHLTSVITSARTYNERHVQNQLNSAILPPLQVAEAIALISSLPPSEQREALNQLSGEQYTNLVQSNQTASQQFMRRMYESVRYDSLGLRCGENCVDMASLVSCWRRANLPTKILWSKRI